VVFVIVGVGIDVVGIERFAACLRRAPRLAERLFTDSEIGLPVESLAARFAAKEALAKALDSPGNLAWRDAEVLRPTGEGKTAAGPRLAVYRTVARRCEELGVVHLHVSLSHDAGQATALVIAEA
jgi:holo-[acyl-carrier protein] synthase